MQRGRLAYACVSCDIRTCSVIVLIASSIPWCIAAGASALFNQMCRLYRKPLDDVVNAVVSALWSPTQIIFKIASKHKSKKREREAQVFLLTIFVHVWLIFSTLVFFFFPCYACALHSRQFDCINRWARSIRALNQNQICWTFWIVVIRQIARIDGHSK